MQDTEDLHVTSRNAPLVLILWMDMVMRLGVIALAEVFATMDLEPALASLVSLGLAASTRPQ